MHRVTECAAYTDNRERHQLRLVITGGKLGGRGQVDIDVSRSVARSQEAHIVVILDKVQN